MPARKRHATTKAKVKTAVLAMQNVVVAVNATTAVAMSVPTTPSKVRPLSVASPVPTVVMSVALTAIVALMKMHALTHLVKK